MDCDKVIYNGAMGAGIGILGGTFDPIHYGHLAIAEDARVTLGLDRVLFVPAAQQPLKYGQHAAPATHRLAMVQLACESNPAFQVSTVEIERAGVSYTVTTLEALRAQTAVELFFILGVDALADLPKWHRANDIARFAHLVAVGRPESDLDLALLQRAVPSIEGRVHMLEGPQIELSSTALRQRIGAGRSLRYLVPDNVIAYIERHELYRNVQPSSIGAEHGAAL